MANGNGNGNGDKIDKSKIVWDKEPAIDKSEIVWDDEPVKKKDPTTSGSGLEPSELETPSTEQTDPTAPISEDEQYNALFGAKEGEEIIFNTKEDVEAEIKDIEGKIKQNLEFADLIYRKTKSEMDDDVRALLSEKSKESYEYNKLVQRRLQELNAKKETLPWAFEGFDPKTLDLDINLGDYFVSDNIPSADLNRHIIERKLGISPTPGLVKEEPVKEEVVEEESEFKVQGVGYAEGTVLTRMQPVADPIIIRDIRIQRSKNDITSLKEQQAKYQTEIDLIGGNIEAASTPEGDLIKRANETLFDTDPNQGVNDQEALMDNIKVLNEEIKIREDVINEMESVNGVLLTDKKLARIEMDAVAKIEEIKVKEVKEIEGNMGAALYNSVVNGYSNTTNNLTKVIFMGTAYAFPESAQFPGEDISEEEAVNRVSGIVDEMGIKTTLDEQLKSDGASPEYIQQQKEKGIFYEGIFGLAESAFPMMTPKMVGFFVNTTIDSFEEISLAHPEMSIEGKMSYSAAQGTVVMLMNKWAMSNMIKNKSFVKEMTNRFMVDQMKKGVSKLGSSESVKAAKRILTAGLSEFEQGAGEYMSAEVIKQMTDGLSGVDGFKYKGIKRYFLEMAHAGATEAVGGLAMGAASTSIGRLTSSEAKDKAAALLEENYKLKQAIADPKISDSDKVAMQDKLKENTEGLFQIAAEANAEANKYTEKENIEIGQKEGAIASNEAVLQNPEISTEAKEQAEENIVTLNEEINQIKDKPDAIQEPETEGVPVQPEAERGEEVRGEDTKREEVTQEGKKEDKIEERVVTELPGEGKVKPAKTEPYDGKDYSKGRKSEEIAKDEGVEFTTPEEAERHIAEKSENPQEMAESFERTVKKMPESEQKDYKAQVIEDSNIKITPEEFKQYSDPKLASKRMDAKFVDSKRKTPLDAKLKEISEDAGIEITPDDFADYMRAFEQKAEAPKEIGTLPMLRDRFKELTGKALTPKLAGEITAAAKIKADTTKKVEAISKEFEEQQAGEKAADEAKGKPKEVKPQPISELSGIKKKLVSPEVQAKFEYETATDKEVMDRGKTLVDKGNIKPKRIVDDITGGDYRALQPDEVAGLIYYKAQLDNELNKVTAEQGKLSAEGKSTIGVDKEIAELNDRIEAYEMMSLITAQQMSRAFRLRQYLRDSNTFNVVKAISQYKAANKGNIPKEVKARFREVGEESKKLIKRINELEAERELQIETDAFQNIVDDVVAKAKPKKKKRDKDKGKRTGKVRARAFKRKYKKGPPTVTIKDENGNDIEVPLVMHGVSTNQVVDLISSAIEKAGSIQDAVNMVVEKIKDQDWYKKLSGANKRAVNKQIEDLINEDFDIGDAEITWDDKGNLKIAPKLIRKHVAEGVHDINELTAILHEQAIAEGFVVTKRQVRDAITNYGITTFLSEEKVNVAMRKLKRVGKLLSALEDAKQKKRPLRSGLQRDEITDTERRMQVQINELLKDIPQSSEEIEGAFKSALDKAKTRLENRKKDLIDQIAKGEKPTAKKAIELDKDAKDLKEEVKVLQQKLDDIVGKPEMTYDQKINVAIKATEKSLENIESQLKAGGLLPGKKAKIFPTPKLAALRKKRDKARDELKALRREKGIGQRPKKSEIDKYKDRVTKRISAIKDELAGNKKQREKIEIAKDEEALALDKEKAVLQAALDEMRGKPEMSEEQKLKSAENAAQKSLDKVNEQIADLGKMDTVKIKVKPTGKLKELLDERDRRKKVLTWLREETGIAEGVKLKKTKGRVRKQIVELQEKIKNKDFAKKEPKKLQKMDRELQSIKAVRENLMEEVRSEQYKIEQKNRDNWQKAYDIGVDILGALPRAFIASWDLSAAGVQGLWYIARDPKNSAIAFGKSVAALVSAKHHKYALAKIKSQPYYHQLKQAGVAIIEEGHEVTAKEEQVVGNIINTLWNIPAFAIDQTIGRLFPKSKKVGGVWRDINPYMASQRAYTAYLNHIRIATFLKFADGLASQGITMENEPKSYKAAAKFVNAATGRGSLEAVGLESSNALLNILLFSSRRTAATLQLFANPVYWARMPKEVRWMAARDMVQAIGTLGAFTFLMQELIGDDEDDDDFFDPRSTNFMKVKVKGKDGSFSTISFLGPVQSLMTTMSRLWSGQFRSATTGEIEYLGERSPTVSVKTRADVFLNYFGNKKSPGIAAGLKVFGQSKGRELSTEQLLKETTTPIWFHDIMDVVEDHPPLASTLLTGLNMIGLGTQHFKLTNDQRRAKLRAADRSESNVRKHERYLKQREREAEKK